MPNDKEGDADQRRFQVFSAGSLQGRAFGLEQYKSLLKRAKAKKPEKIMEWLEREPDPLRAGS